MLFLHKLHTEIYQQIRLSLLFLTLLITVVICQNLYVQNLYGQNPDHWGLKEATPAVVHSAVKSSYQEILSLRGEWEFVQDSGLFGRHRMGKGPGWNEPDWSGVRSITVPGCWESQGVGEPGISHTWDCLFDNNKRPLRHIYIGVARYRKTIEIPANWKNQQVWLKIGGVKAEGYFWVNKTRVGYINNYCGTYKFNVTDLVKPGEKAEIVAMVRNDSPSRKGLMSACHTFGGFYRDVELEATPNTWIDNVWVRGDIQKKTAKVRVYLRSMDNNVSGSNVSGLNVPGSNVPGRKVNVVIKTLDGKQMATGHTIIFLPGKNVPQNTSSVVEVETINMPGMAELEIPIPDLKLWSPESPNLYLADIILLNEEEKPIHGWTERFGIRKMEVVGDKFYLNGQPYFLRGYGDDFVYPMTLNSPADKDYHVKNMKVIKEAGFNYVRLHTHCEIPEYFEAADEVGILVQPELPYYHDITTEAFIFDPLRDVRELFEHYRRYVSFASYSLGNEGHLGSPLDKQIYQWVKKNDPDRILQHQDGGCNTPENSDYDSPNGYTGPSSILPWAPGAFDYLKRPFIAHEYMNLGIKLDPRLSPRFTGIMPPYRPLNKYEESLKKVGLDRNWGDACLNAAHGLQAYYQKWGLEQARIDPACDGFSYWTLVDVIVPQGNTYTGQGFLNAFYEAKPGGLTPAQFKEFNSPVVLLAKFNSNSDVAVSGEVLNVDFWISQFADTNLPKGELTWALVANGKTLCTGKLPHSAIATGTVTSLGVCNIVIPEIKEPVSAELVVSLKDGNTVNRWKKWLFPKREKPSLDNIVVSPSLKEIMEQRYTNVVLYGDSTMKPHDILLVRQSDPVLYNALAEGRSVLLIGNAMGNPNVRLGWWSLGSQLGTTFAKHSAFGNFPNSANINPLWFRIIKQGMIDLNTENELGHFEPLAVGEGVDTYYLYLGQCMIGKSRLFASFGIDLLAPLPESCALLDNFINYVRSKDFQPTVQNKEISPEKLKNIQRVETLGQRLNSWGNLIEAKGFSCGGNYFLGNATIHVLGFTKQRNELIWETKAIPKQEDDTDYSLVFATGVGFDRSAINTIDLFVNKEPVLKFNIGVSDKSWSVKNNGVVLEYLRVAGDERESNGFMILTLPKSKIIPGKPLEIRCVGDLKNDGNNMDKWFGVIEK